ncbi:MAG: hypothetical protein J0H25_09870, partial [Rhizobiales bacterium]|nr:hypothetical protein [Hyphomicrobiales bacterium]
KAIAARLAEADGSPSGVVAACSSLKRSYRAILTSGVSRRTSFVFLDGSQALLSERMKTRKGHFMPPGLLASQFETLEMPTADEHVITTSIDADVETIVDDIVRKLSAPI